MNLTYVIKSISNSHGGTAEYIKTLSKKVSKTHSVSIIADRINNKQEFNKNIKLYNSNNYIIPFFFRYNNFLSNIKTDLFHVNGLWDSNLHCVSKYAKKNKIPYIFSTHGMLDEWSLKNKYLKKQIALKMYQYKDLKFAKCLHATSLQEMNNLRNLGLTNPIALIPNGVNLEKFTNFKKSINKIRRVLFLSRIHPIKGIELLIESWIGLSKKNINNSILEIIGPGDRKYIKKLKEHIKSKNLQNNIKIKPPLYADEKIKKMRESDLFILPSYSENFGIVVAEALACKIPVITTTSTPWTDLERFNCGKQINLDVSSLSKSLDLFLNMSDGDLLDLGNNGRELVKKKYSINSVFNMTNELYNWTVNFDTKPNFIHL